MRVLAFDPYVWAERFRELGVERAETPGGIYAQSDFITLHLPRTPETRGWLDAEAFAQMRDGVRIVNCARGELVDDEALKDALDSGKVAGAALDVFPSEPITDTRCYGYDNVVVTPHLGASTTEAQDRAGVQTAEQVVAALTGGVVTTAVNIPSVGAEDMEVLGPFMPLAEQLGRIGMALAEGSSVDRVEIELLGRLAERDTRLLRSPCCSGVLAGHTEEEVNLVNAPALAEERGIDVVETKRTTRPRLHRPGAGDARRRRPGARVVGTTIGHRHRPHLLEAWGQRFNIQLEGHVALLPLLRRAGHGRARRHGVRRARRQHRLRRRRAASPTSEGGRRGGDAAMAIMTDAPVPATWSRRSSPCDGFVDGRAVKSDAPANRSTRRRPKRTKSSGLRSDGG